MSTNFFRQLTELSLTGDIQITIRQASDNRLAVSVLLQNEQCGDNAKKQLIPLTLNGTVEELDEGFFEQITKPLQSASSLMVNMEAYLKQLEEAKKRSAMEKEKADKEQKVKEEKDKKYQEAMQKVEALEKAGKYREAWMKVPNPADYPDHTDILQNRRKELADKFSTPDLFEGDRK